MKKDVDEDSTIKKIISNFSPTLVRPLDAKNGTQSSVARGSTDQDPDGPSSSDATGRLKGNAKTPRDRNAPPDNSAQLPVRKSLRGLRPGDPIPGAYEVRRMAHGQAPLWEQQGGGEDSMAGIEDSMSSASERSNSSSLGEASTEHHSHYFGKRRKCVVVAAFSLLVLIATGTGIGVALILNKDSKEENSRLSGGDSVSCDFQGMAQPDFQKQCSCHRRVDILSQETLARLDDVQAVLGLLGSQVDITSCEPANISLLLLASTDTSFASDEILLNRYVLNIIYLSMGGTNWTNNDGWLETNDSCTCCFYGVRCEGESAVAIGLPDNKLVGTIPSELALLPALSSLDLSRNQNIFGTLPTVLGQLTNLVFISLSASSITGTIPTELGLLSKLESVLLDTNYLFGSIPEELANLTRLIQFGVGHNLIDQHGPIPMWLWQTSIRALDLNGCGIDGSLPSQLGLMTALTALYLNVNFLKGTIPTEIGRLTQLQVLSLSSNSIEGTVPAHLASCISLVRLYLHDNSLQGTIPNDALGRLSHLLEFDLSGNYLSGSIPASEDTGLCGLQKTGKLSKLVVNCQKLYSLSDVVCDCCMECYNVR